MNRAGPTVPAPVTVAVAVPWEGRRVAVQAIFGHRGLEGGEWIGLKFPTASI